MFVIVKRSSLVYDISLFFQSSPIFCLDYNPTTDVGDFPEDRLSLAGGNMTGDKLASRDGAAADTSSVDMGDAAAGLVTTYDDEVGLDERRMEDEDKGDDFSLGRQSDGKVSETEEDHFSQGEEYTDEGLETEDDQFSQERQSDEEGLENGDGHFPQGRQSDDEGLEKEGPRTEYDEEADDVPDTGAGRCECWCAVVVVWIQTFCWDQPLIVRQCPSATLRSMPCMIGLPAPCWHLPDVCRNMILLHVLHLLPASPLSSFS